MTGQSWDMEKATEGERLVLRFLQETARPRGEYDLWYEPQLGPTSITPDFVLYGRSLGLVVIEVKDWASHQILFYNPHRFTVALSGHPEPKTNPLKQARTYVYALMEMLKGHGEFLSHAPGYEGRLKIPIGRMVVFPHILRREWGDRGLHHLIPWETALFQDDLDPAGKIRCDESGRTFKERMSGCLPFPFRGMEPREEEKLRFLLWPEGRIDLPERAGMGKAHFREEVQYLDDAQARAALRLRPGHQVIKGPPGSGKTLVLVHRCAHLVRYHAQRKRILLVCFNIALVSFLRRLVQEKGIGVGEGGVEVFHFFELCSRVLGEALPYEREGTDFYDMVIQETLSRVEGAGCPVGPYDAVLVDEGQDFSVDMLRVVLGLLRPGGDLVIAQDSRQDLYLRGGASWKSLGVRASGRTTHLRNVYRNTAEIFSFAQRFLGEEPRAGRPLPLFPDDSAFHGEAPEIRRLGDMDKVIAFVADDLKACVGSGEYRRSEIAVIYDDKTYGPASFAYTDRDLPARLLKGLDRAGIPAAWVSRDVRAKEMYDVTTDRVSLISVHSAKGLDFDLVYLVGMDRMTPPGGVWDKAVSLAYTAMTRARYRLVIPYVEETELVGRMKGASCG
jgi:hypothetical protein